MQLDPPIEVTFPDEEQPEVFARLEAVDEWVHREHEFWNKLKNDLESANPRFGFNFGSQIKHFAVLAKNVDEAKKFVKPQLDGAIANIRQGMTDLQSTAIIRSYSPRGKHLLSLAESDPQSALGLVAAWYTREFDVSDLVARVVNGDNRSKVVFSNWIRGLVAVQIFDQGIRGNARAEKSALSSLRGEWRNVLNDEKKIFEKFKSENAIINLRYVGQIDQQRGFGQRLAKIALWTLQRGKKHLNEQLSQLREFYEHELQFEVPVKYWRNREVGHRRWAIRWGIVFTLLLGGVLAGMGVWSNELVNYAKGFTELKGFSLVPAFVLGIPTLVLIWGLRIVAQLMHANLAQMRDASERAVMTEVFLAFEKEGKTTVEDRILILHSLFRSAAVGSSKESAPPNWFDMLMERMTKAKSSGG